MGYHLPMRREWPLLVIILAYLFVAVLYAVNTPAWQAPDEPAHYSYIRQLADGNLPVIEPGDYDQAYQSLVISSGFDPRYSVEPFSYEDWQPPGYYLAALPIYVLADGALTSLRLVSVLMGAGVVVFAYLAAREIWPGNTPANRSRALTATVFVAFLPQHVAMLAAVNNDSLAELLIAAILWLLLVQLRPADLEAGKQEQEAHSKSLRRWGVIGFLLGLGFVVKASAYLMAPLIALTLLWMYRRQWRRLVRCALWVLVPAAILGLLWWARNVIVYEGFDPLASAAHNAVVVGQPRTAEWLALYGVAEVAVRFMRTTFNSFWGQFGWMAAPMPNWVYGPLLLFSLATVGGLVLLAVTAGSKGRGETGATGGGTVGGRERELRARLSGPRVSPQVLLLATLFLFSVLAYLGYNLIFVQHQGRYLFSALIPIGIGVGAGLGALARPAWNRLPWTIYLLPLGLGVALFALDLLALYRFIIPYLGGG